MSNYVVVTGTFINAAGQPNAGNVLFEMSDICWDTSAPWVGVIAPVGVTLSTSGTLSVSLFAMDNAGVSGNWFWKCTITLSGIIYPARLLTVAYAAGATQDLSALLNTSKLA